MIQHTSKTHPLIGLIDTYFDEKQSLKIYTYEGERTYGYEHTDLLRAPSVVMVQAEPGSRKVRITLSFIRIMADFHEVDQIFQVTNEVRTFLEQLSSMGAIEIVTCPQEQK